MVDLQQVDGVVVLAGVNAEGTPKFINGTYLVSGLDADGVAHPLRVSDSGELAGILDYIHIRDEKAASTNGGSFTTGDWRTRDLNTIVTNEGSYASLAANRITLAAGTYIVTIRCPGVLVGVHRARLRNITDGSTILLSSNAYADATNVVANDCWINGKFTLTDTKVLEVQHRCGVTRNNDGFGVASTLDTEIYTEVMLQRRRS